MGYRKDDNSLYIYGGMGNESGEQIVGRQYFYDLHKVDLNNNTVSKLWEIPWNRENIVPVREMVIQDDSYFIRFVIRNIVLILISNYIVLHSKTELFKY